MKIITKLICVCVVVSMFAQMAVGQRDELAGYNDPPSRLRGVIERFDADVGILNRFYSAGTSAKRSARFRQLYADGLRVLAGLNFDLLNHDEQVDYILFKNYLEHEDKEAMRYQAQLTEMASLMPLRRRSATSRTLGVSLRRSMRQSRRRCSMTLRNVSPQCSGRSSRKKCPAQNAPLPIVPPGQSASCVIRCGVGTAITICTTRRSPGGASRRLRRRTMRWRNIRVYNFAACRHRGG
ncbi:MAG: hypothetical protein IPI64_15630 [Chloracidobacterium sp.]|nr:hypothetical protein [Chloracidobacterium sp.]